MQIKKFFQNKSIGGFYVPAVSVLLSIVASTVFYLGFIGTKYYVQNVVLLPLLAAIAFIALSISSKTSFLASLVDGLLQFWALTQFMTGSYMYLTEAFYDGVSWNAIRYMNKAWPLTLVLLIVNVVLCNIGVYKKQERSVE